MSRGPERLRASAALAGPNFCMILEVLPCSLWHGQISGIMKMGPARGRRPRNARPMNQDRGAAAGRVRVGISGWRYAGWRGDFYPPGLPQRRELEYVAQRLTTVEINGSFYSLQRPSSYRLWHDQTPDGFVFAVKGGRFITHMKKLRGVERGARELLRLRRTRPSKPNSARCCGSCRRRWASIPTGWPRSSTCCRVRRRRRRASPKATTSGWPTAL